VGPPPLGDGQRARCTVVFLFLQRFFIEGIAGAVKA
jgi:hypothetical protein